VSARQPAEYMNPYFAGIGVGLALLLAFVLVGRGLGASGAFASVVTTAVSAAAPEHARASADYARYLPADGSPLRDWLVLEIAGVLVGAWASAKLAGRLRLATERGPRVAAGARLTYAFIGGMTMGIGARLARGCTSGLGLTGGATLSVGSWLFVLAAFAAAFAVAPMLRKQWT
jgi:uncharacterized protein